jgi:uncharacterized protein YlzI (FlbEa/FlbD family)
MHQLLDEDVSTSKSSECVYTNTVSIIVRSDVDQVLLKLILYFFKIQLF